MSDDTKLKVELQDYKTALDRMTEQAEIYIEQREAALAEVARLKVEVREERETLAALEVRCFEGYPSAPDGIFDRVAELEKLINTPEILDFVKAVQLEAAHQRERWASDHDAGKTDADWFWLIGYLAGKALHTQVRADCNCFHACGSVLAAPAGHRDQCEERAALEKKLHRIITVAAAACNWHAAVLGLTNMRPGIAEPKA